MIKNIYLYLSMVVLFAFAQISLPTLTTSHLMNCHQEQHQDQGETEHHCEQCLSLSHATDTSLSQGFHVEVMAFGCHLVATLEASISINHFFSYSVRAPPYYSLVEHLTLLVN